MDTDAANELKELREQNPRLKLLLTEAELERRVAGGSEGTISRPAAKRRAVDMLKETLSMSEPLACTAVGLARSTYRRLPMAQTSADPDAELRAWLRAYATKHPCHAFFGGPGRRCATTSAVRSTRRSPPAVARGGPPGQDRQPAQAGRGLLGAADRC